MKMRVTPNPGTGTEMFNQDSFSENSDNGEHDDMEPTAAESNDFSEYLWMENEEEFDKEVLKQLEEEALMEQCIQAMLEDERENANSHVDNELKDGDLNNQLDKISLHDSTSAELVKKSTLNPNAAEFVPKKPAKQEFP